MYLSNTAKRTAMSSIAIHHSGCMNLIDRSQRTGRLHPTMCSQSMKVPLVLSESGIRFSLTNESVRIKFIKGLKNNKLTVLCNGYGPKSDYVGIGERKNEFHAEPLSGDVSKKTCIPDLAPQSGTKGASSEESLFQTKPKKLDSEVTPSSTYQILPKRWIIVILCFFAFLLCNMDRVNMSIAILPMSSEFHWDHTTVGLVQSSFFWGYLLTQIAGGVWADRVGGKQVLGFGVIWWSLATMATPIAAKLGLPVLLIVRACMGIGEGVAMPAMNNLLSKWVPLNERSRSLALVYSGMYLGSVTGLAFSPSLIHKFSWPSVFWSFGFLGSFWYFAWQHLASSSPLEDPGISTEEKTLIAKSSLNKEPIDEIPWKLLLSKVPVWALIVCHFCHNYGTFILLTWMPTYYCQVLKFNLTESGLFSVLPWLSMAAAANFGGWIADTLVSNGVSVTNVRKLMQSLGFLGPAFFLTQLSHINSPFEAVLCMICSQGFDAFSQSGLYSNHQDIGPRYAGVLLGLSNTAGVLAGVIGTAATGYILQHGTWDDVFKVAVGLYLGGTVVWNLFATGERIFD
ncbi:hypothetical protein KP509_06G055000 [Ceratopteris richardii]|nr:hypothetical protein KP509_06G055000 [Ceratopteris richardii]KAH7435221.1 hypothetical protein KP509_06G055000 [Ceratopteris richardii]KAH7435224.1 hypothetical protein KP509_06G055000 [Ceratopteris richardii]KAH7435225.1 hypothetical protein KP509_06G055000 [Ceratopteris richardii]KAH7435226.1 hypothetical protein KP509_06G055000 [Ceratopteris richardii]